MTVRRRAVLFCLVFLGRVCCGAATEPAPPVCAGDGCYFVFPMHQGPGADTNKDVLKAVIDAARQIYPPTKNGVTFTPVGDRILVSWDTRGMSDADKRSLPESLRKLLRGIAASPDVPGAPPENFVAHLLYNRNAGAIATILSNTFPGLSATSVGDDTILMSSALDSASTEQAQQQRDEIEEAKRLVAVADFPRPSVAITAWNLRISASDDHDAQGRRAKESIEAQSKVIGNLSSTHNLIVQNAIDQGWKYLAGQIGEPSPCTPPSFLNATFFQYLAAPVVADTKCQKVSGLGYRGLFNPLPPDLTQMLLAVLAADKPADAEAAVLQAMERRSNVEPEKIRPGRFMAAYSKGPAQAVGPLSERDSGRGMPAPQRACEELDYNSYPQEQTVDHLQLSCVRQTLDALLQDSPDGRASKLGELRSLIAEFLFHYRASQLQPHEMSPFGFTAAAHNLDSALAPIMDAFTRDIEVFQTKLQEEILDNPVDKHLGFSAGSIVTVRTLSDNEAKVDVQTQNFFDATNPPTLQQFADALATAEKDQPKILTGNLSADAVTGALAALSVVSQSKATAKLGDGVSLTVMPHSLLGASGMELNLTLNADETTDSTAGVLTEGSSTASADLTSRVAKHDVTTLVRLDSLKLTEVSTVASELVRAKRPLPVILPFLEFPVIGGLVQLPRAPSHVFHRSFAIVSAMEVPTAADLASTIPFNTERSKETADELEEQPGTPTTSGQASAKTQQSRDTTLAERNAWKQLSADRQKMLSCFAYLGKSANCPK